MVERFAFPNSNWKINPFGNWVRVSDFEKVEKRAYEAEANLEACRTLAATLRVENEALRAKTGVADMNEACATEGCGKSAIARLGIGSGSSYYYCRECCLKNQPPPSFLESRS